MEVSKTYSVLSLSNPTVQGDFPAGRRKELSFILPGNCG